MSGLVLGFSGCRKLSSHSASIATFVIASAVTQPSCSSLALVVAHLVLRSGFFIVCFLPFTPLCLPRFVPLCSTFGCSVCPSCSCCWCIGGFPRAFLSIRAGSVHVPFSLLLWHGLRTWATAALAAGLGRPVYVAGIHSSSLPSSWGRWVRSSRLPGCGVWFHLRFLLLSSCPFSLSSNPFLYYLKQSQEEGGWVRPPPPPVMLHSSRKS